MSTRPHRFTSEKGSHEKSGLPSSLDQQERRQLVLGGGSHGLGWGGGVVLGSPCSPGVPTAGKK